MSRFSSPERAAGPTTFAALMLGQAAQGLAFTAFTPALSTMAKDFNTGGHGMIAAQQILTIASAGVILGAFVSGTIVGRYGARDTMLVCLAALGLCGASGLIFHALWAQLAARIVVGFAVSCMVTACLATIAALYEGNARASAIGASSAMGSVASLVGLIAGGALAQALGWRAAFIQYPVFAVLGLALAFAGLPKVPHASVPAPIAAGEAGAKLWPLYLLTIAVSAVMFMGSTQFAFLLPLDGVNSAAGIGLVMSAITALGALTAFLFGAIERRLGMQGALVAGLASITASLTLIGSFTSPAAAIAGAALMGIYVGIVMPYVFHAVTMKASAHARPQALGLVNACIFVGALINPYLFAPVSGAFGLHGLFIIVGLAMAVLACAAAVRRTPATA